jgi:hypothetical protein
MRTSHHQADQRRERCSVPQASQVCSVRCLSIHKQRCLCPGPQNRGRCHLEQVTCCRIVKVGINTGGQAHCRWVTHVRLCVLRPNKTNEADHCFYSFGESVSSREYGGQTVFCVNHTLRENKQGAADQIWRRRAQAYLGSDTVTYRDALQK